MFLRLPFVVLKLEFVFENCLKQDNLEGSWRKFAVFAELSLLGSFSQESIIKCFTYALFIILVMVQIFLKHFILLLSISTGLFEIVSRKPGHIWRNCRTPRAPLIIISLPGWYQGWYLIFPWRHKHNTISSDTHVTSFHIIPKVNFRKTGLNFKV